MQHAQMSFLQATSPLEQARLEIGALEFAPELKLCRPLLGRSLTIDEFRDNEQRKEERIRREIAIMQRHGVMQDFLDEYRRRARPLQEELAPYQKRIDSLVVRINIADR